MPPKKYRFSHLYHIIPDVNFEAFSGGQNKHIKFHSKSLHKVESSAVWAACTAPVGGEGEVQKLGKLINGLIRMDELVG